MVETQEKKDIPLVGEECTLPISWRLGLEGGNK